MSALGAHAVETHGRLDGWFDNAGIVKPAPIEEMPVSDFAQELAVDLTGTWRGCKVAATAMRLGPRIGRSSGHSSGRIRSTSTRCFQASRGRR